MGVSKSFPACLALCLGVTLPLAEAAALRGIVIENRTGRPLARAQVLLEPLSSTATASSLSALTDSRGLFEFSPLSAGSYLLKTRKRGYADASYGQRRWDLPGTPILLQADGDFAADLRLRRLAAVGGEVTDENRVGLPDCTVYAYEVGKRLKVAAVAQTDDRGVFRLAGLLPGRYFIRTAAKRLEGDRDLLPTFFGQTHSAREARPVDVRLEEERQGVGIAPLPGRLSRLSGVVTGAGAASVTLFTDSGAREEPLRPGGVFRFDQLAPGDYQLLAESSAGAGKWSGYARIRVSGEEVYAVLEMKPAPRLSVRCQESRGQPFDPRTISIFLRRKDFEDSSIRLSCAEPALASPGDWEVAAMAPPELYVVGILDARQGDQAQEFSLAPAEQRDLTLMLSSRTATLRGLVRTTDGQPAIGAPVFLYAYDPGLRNRLGGARTARADQDGRYRFVGLPPGQYEVLASFQIREAGQAGWEPGLGQTVALAEGTEETLDLRLLDQP